MRSRGVRPRGSYCVSRCAGCRRRLACPRRPDLDAGGGLGSVLSRLRQFASLRPQDLESSRHRRLGNRARTPGDSTRPCGRWRSRPTVPSGSSWPRQAPLRAIVVFSLHGMTENYSVHPLHVRILDRILKGERRDDPETPLRSRGRQASRSHPARAAQQGQGRAALSVAGPDDLVLALRAPGLVEDQGVHAGGRSRRH